MRPLCQDGAALAGWPRGAERRRAGPLSNARRGRASTLTAIAATAGAALVAACASPTTPRSIKAFAPRAPRATTQAAAHDWHALLLLPFGTLLKDVPYPLSEVVVFHDAAGAAGAHQDRDCYSLEGTAPPRFFGRRVDAYSLCFSSDRLSRVEASLTLPAESASAQFAAACAEWQQRGTPGGTSSDRCEERDGATQLVARLTPGTAAAPTVSITLIDSAPARGGGP